MLWTVLAPIEAVPPNKEGEETLRGRQLADLELKSLSDFGRRYSSQ